MRRTFTTDDLKTRTGVVTEAAHRLAVGIGGSDERPELVMLSYEQYLRLRDRHARAVDFEELPQAEQDAFMADLTRTVDELSRSS